MRILIVEDDDILRDGLKVGLALAGFTTDAVDTCDAAATALAANGFDARPIFPCCCSPPATRCATGWRAWTAAQTTISASPSTSTRSPHG